MDTTIFQSKGILVSKSCRSKGLELKRVKKPQLFKKIHENFLILPLNKRLWTNFGQEKSVDWHSFEEIPHFDYPLKYLAFLRSSRVYIACLSDKCLNFFIEKSIQPLYSFVLQFLTTFGLQPVKLIFQ